MEAKCATNCLGNLCYLEVENTFLLCLRDEHKCLRSLRNREPIVEWIVRLYLDSFRRNSNWVVFEMLQNLQNRFNITNFKIKCYRAKWKTLLMLSELFKEYNNFLGSYIVDLRSVNGNIFSHIMIDRSNADSRFYVGFSCLIQGFLLWCWPIIGLDWCFLITFVGWQLLSAIGWDGNNQMLSMP